MNKFKIWRRVISDQAHKSRISARLNSLLHLDVEILIKFVNSQVHDL